LLQSQWTKEIGAAIARMSATQLERWLFDPRPLNESPYSAPWAKSVHLNRSGKNKISGFSLPPNAVTKMYIQKLKALRQ